MAIDATHWTVTRSTGDIRYIGNDHTGGSPTYATVIEFHRWLQDLADDASSTGDDELDITDELPSSRSTDNIITLLGTYNIDDTAAEHLYDGSIIQSSGDEIYDGIVNFGNSGINIQIIQDGAVLADDWWNDDGSSNGLNEDAAAGISHRFMLKVRTGGADTDGRRVLGTCRTFGNTYSEFSINGSSRGNNVLALSDASDLNNGTAEGTVSGWSTIDNATEGYAAIDVNGNAVDEYYYSEWNADIGTRTINDFYERMKWLTRDGSVSTIYGINGELFRGITHEIELDGGSGTWDPFEAVSWTGGTGQMLAIDNIAATSSSKMWIQLLTGVAPSNNDTITGGSSSADNEVNITVTDRSSLISTPFIGASTGSALIGAYGIGLETNDLTASDKVFDLDNAQVTPPNNVTFSVAGLISTEDRVLVAPWDGVSTDSEGNPAIEVDQMSLDVALTSGTETAVDVGTIPVGTPSSGDIRIQMDDGRYREITYNSYAGSVFAIDSTTFSGDEAAISNNVYVAYIDVLAGSTTESYTAVHSSDQDLVVIVRDGGASPIKQFISSASFSGSNTTITAIRTSDT